MRISSNLSAMQAAANRHTVQRQTMAQPTKRMRLNSTRNFNDDAVNISSKGAKMAAASKQQGAEAEKTALPSSEQIEETAHGDVGVGSRGESSESTGKTEGEGQSALPTSEDIEENAHEDVGASSREVKPDEEAKDAAPIKEEKDPGDEQVQKAEEKLPNKMKEPELPSSEDKTEKTATGEEAPKGVNEEEEKSALPSSEDLEETAHEDVGVSSREEKKTGETKPDESREEEPADSPDKPTEPAKLAVDSYKNNSGDKWSQEGNTYDAETKEAYSTHL